MPSKFDLEDTSWSVTENQRLENRRFEAGYAFETMPQAEYDRRNLSPGQFGKKDAR
jgi:hypothetical protein